MSQIAKCNMFINIDQKSSFHFYFNLESNIFRFFCIFDLIEKDYLFILLLLQLSSPFRRHRSNFSDLHADFEKLLYSDDVTVVVVVVPDVVTIIVTVVVVVVKAYKSE